MLKTNKQTNEKKNDHAQLAEKPAAPRNVSRMTLKVAAKLSGPPSSSMVCYWKYLSLELLNIRNDFTAQSQW